MNYYNEYDKKTAAWLRELIRAGAIPDGIVDERSIAEVKPSDLTGFTQCHFFAGIGGWSLALQLAGWPEDRPVWTGSCPCQPFSSAGKGLAQADERHLWPVFFDLIRQCRPEHVFGEQVASAIGKHWLDGVSSDLESEGYACGATVLGAHSVGAPHIRQRLFWVADTRHGECWRENEQKSGAEISTEREQGAVDVERRCSTGGMAYSKCARLEGCAVSEMVRSGISSKNSWGVSKQHLCRDGKTRRIPAEPAFFPLANGVSPARVVILRGAGNAIVPQVAAEFVAAFCEC